MRVHAQTVEDRRLQVLRQHAARPSLAWWEHFGSYQRELDPLTTEVVRLRGAVQHNCRLCKSRREGHALDAGGSESLYAEIEDYESAEQLSDRHKAALRYVDALIWSPSRIDSEVVDGVRTHFPEEGALELTLDVMRNACNKIMVSLGADAPQVSEGTELFMVEADGQTVVAS